MKEGRGMVNVECIEKKHNIEGGTLKTRAEAEDLKALRQRATRATNQQSDMPILNIEEEEEEVYCD